MSTHYDDEPSFQEYINLFQAYHCQQKHGLWVLTKAYEDRRLIEKTLQQMEESEPTSGWMSRVIPFHEEADCLGSLLGCGCPSPPSISLHHHWMCDEDDCFG